MLATYLQRVQRLLGDQVFERFNAYDLIAWINEARSHIAGEGEAIRLNGTLTTAVNVEQYSNASIVLPTGANGVLTIYSIVYNRAVGGLPPLLLESCPWEWFQLYWRTMGQTGAAPPRAWAPFAFGLNGSFFIGPISDGLYPLSIDATCTPVALKTDTDVELLPYPWTDAVAFYVAALAMRSEVARGRAQQPQVDKFTEDYDRMLIEARSIVTPPVLPGNYPGGMHSRRAPGSSPTIHPEMAPTKAAP